MAIPKDNELYEKIKKKVYKDIPKHSAYRSGILVSSYKDAYEKKYGDRNAYVGKKKPSASLTTWFNEKWRNTRGEVGYKFKSDVYRPTKRVNKDTPKTFKELSKKQIERAKREKAKTGRVKKF